MSGMKQSPRERRYERTKQSILDAARRIINEEGVDSLSMRAIARKIDYSPAGLYEYFDGKEDIVAAVCAEGDRRLNLAMSTADDDLDPIAYMGYLGNAYIRFAQEYPDYFLLMFTTPPSRNPAVGDLDELRAEDSAFSTLLDGIQRGIDAGLFQTRDGFGQLEMAMSAWATVHGLSMLYLNQIQYMPLDFENVKDQTLRNFIMGLMAA